MVLLECFGESIGAFLKQLLNACRDTQTVQQKNALQQTANETSTQMTKIGVYVSNMPDKLLQPGKYTTADERERMILDRVLTIQKYYRRWLARRFVERVKKDRDTRLAWERDIAERRRQEKLDRIRDEFERRMNPRGKEHFDLLYAALESRSLTLVFECSVSFLNIIFKVHYIIWNVFFFLYRVAT